MTDRQVTDGSTKDRVAEYFEPPPDFHFIRRELVGVHVHGQPFGEVIVDLLVGHVRRVHERHRIERGRDVVVVARDDFHAVRALLTLHAVGFHGFSRWI